MYSTFLLTYSMLETRLLVIACMCNADNHFGNQLNFFYVYSLWPLKISDIYDKRYIY